MTDATTSFFDQTPAGRGGFWRYFGGTILIILIQTLLTVGLGIVAGILAVVLGVPFTSEAFNEVKVWANLTPDQDTLALFICAIFMLSFVALLIATLLVAKLLHGQSIRSLLTSRPKFAWGRLLTSALVIMIMAGGGLAIDYHFNSGSYQLIFDWDRFWPFLILGVLFIPVQSFSEEVLFRGYLSQGVGSVTRLLAVRLLVPAALFTLLHGMNAVWAAGGIWIILYYFTLALYLGYLTYASNGLEVAAGLHIGNNLFALLMISSPFGDVPFATVLFSDQTDFVMGYVALFPTLGLHYIIVRSLGLLRA